MDEEDIQELFDTMNKLNSALLANDEHFRLTAEVAKKSYDAYKDAGFSGSEAILLVAASIQKAK